MEELFESYAKYCGECDCFVILKPTFLNHYKEWRQMLIDKGWKVQAERVVKMDPTTAKELYKPHQDKDFFKDLVKYMSSDICVVMTVKKDVDDPVKEMDEIKDEVRNKWGIDDMRNVMHSSDSKENVKRESKIFFDKNR